MNYEWKFKLLLLFAIICPVKASSSSCVHRISHWVRVLCTRVRMCAFGVHVVSSIIQLDYFGCICRERACTMSVFNSVSSSLCFPVATNFVFFSLLRVNNSEMRSRKEQNTKSLCWLPNKINEKKLMCSQQTHPKDKVSSTLSPMQTVESTNCVSHYKRTSVLKVLYA